MGVEGMTFHTYSIPNMIANLENNDGKMVTESCRVNNNQSLLDG